MIVNIKTADENLGKLIQQFLMMLVSVMANPEDLTFEIIDKNPKMNQVESRKGTKLGARIEYKAILPNEPADRKRTIEENIKTLGAHTIKGILYSRVVDMTIKGEQVTEPLMRKLVFNGKAGTSQREIGDLCRAGIVAKVPIVHPAADDDVIY